MIFVTPVRRLFKLNKNRLSLKSLRLAVSPEQYKMALERFMKDLFPLVEGHFTKHDEN